MSPPSDFAGQFVISPVGRSPRDGTVRHRLVTICVDAFNLLDVIDVFDRTGRLIGALLGMAIDTGAERTVTSPYCIDAALDADCDLGPLIEEHIYRLAGSFIFVLDAAGARRVYLDANGSKSLVYDPVADLAAATTSLLLEPADYKRRFNAELYSGLTVDQDGWFPAGMTAHSGIRRLMCNHYLDLDTMRTVRHWPVDGIEEMVHSDGPIDTIIDLTRRTMRALQRTGLATLALTAGHETRLILACCRDFKDKVEFMTVDAPGAELDVARAGDLARRFGLTHRLLPHLEADAEGQRAWQNRVGHCVTGSNMTMHPSVEPLDGRIFVGGLGGEVGRGFLWLDSERGMAVDGAGIVSRLKLPQHPLLLREVEQWLAPLKHYDSLFLLDLAYMELRMSCWAFAQSYAMPRQVEINPIVSRPIYCAMLSLPPSVRRNNGMIVRCIERAWPELLELPINRYGDWRDRLRRARDAFINPRRAIRKVRQIGTVKLGRFLRQPCGLDASADTPGGKKPGTPGTVLHRPYRGWRGA